MTTVLHVLEAVRGGTSRHVADIIASTPEITHHLAVPDRAEARSGARYDTAGLASVQEAGAVLHRLAMRRSATPPTNVAAAARLRRLVAVLRPDVVHGHSAVGGAVARLGAAGRVPVAYTPNGLPTGRAHVLVERALGPLTTVLVAVSPSEARLATDRRLVGPDRVRTIPNGIDLSASPPGAVAGADLRAELGLGPRTPLIGTVVRLVPQKAPEDFVAVAAEVIARRPGTHAVLIGAGPLQGLVDERVATAGIGAAFHQIPHLPRAADAVAQLQVFVLPSRFEGAPYTPLEAMAVGVPVVVSDAVGNVDVVEDGISGRVAPVGDVAALAAAVVDLLDDPVAAGVLAAAAHERVADRFDRAAMGTALAGLYRELAGRSDPGRTRPRATLRG